MHDDRIDRGLLEQHDVAGEFARHMLVAHGVAAIFDDDGFLVVALHIRQGFGQNAGLYLGLTGSLWLIGSMLPAFAQSM